MLKQQVIEVYRGVVPKRKCGIVTLIRLLSVSPVRFTGVTSLLKLSGFYRGDGHK